MNKIPLVLILLYILSGCKSETIIIPGSTGTLKGYVVLYDSLGKFVNDRSGVTVELIGASFSAMTDTNGLWTIENLPTRNYTLRFTKQQYATMLSQVIFVGGGTIWHRTISDPIILQSPPVYSLVLDLITIPNHPYTDSLGSHYPTGAFYAHASGNIPLNINISILFITSKSTNIDVGDASTYSGTLLGFPTIRVTDLTNPVDFSIALNGSSSLFTKFSPGDSIYVRAYPYIINPTNPNSSYPVFYVDPETQNRIYTGFGKGSNVLSGVFQ